MRAKFYHPLSHSDAFGYKETFQPGDIVCGIAPTGTPFLILKFVREQAELTPGVKRRFYDAWDMTNYGIREIQSTSCGGHGWKLISRCLRPTK